MNLFIYMKKKGKDEDIWTLQLEVKFYDLRKTNKGEGICLIVVHWSRTKARGSKMIRYRRSFVCRKRCWLGIWRIRSLSKVIMDVQGPWWEIKSIWVPGGVWLQDWNLKELTERHHKAWSLRLNLTQHGETYQTKTSEGLTDEEVFQDWMGGGAWPFLVGGVICLVNSDNERDFRGRDVSVSVMKGRWLFLMDRKINYRKIKVITGLWCP